MTLRHLPVLTIASGGADDLLWMIQASGTFEQVQTSSNIPNPDPGEAWQLNLISSICKLNIKYTMIISSLESCMFPLQVADIAFSSLAARESGEETAETSDDLSMPTPRLSRSRNRHKSRDFCVVLSSLWRSSQVRCVLQCHRGEGCLLM